MLEWFPALTGRKSIFTVQGTEWTKGEDFTTYVKSTYAVQECLATGDVACLDSAVGKSDYDYIYVSKILRVDNCKPLDPQRTFAYFVESARSDDEFEVVYETDGVMIYKNR